MLHSLIDVFRNTLMITSFVIVIMLIIELVNVFTHGKWSSSLSKRKPLQVLIAALLGLIPGCFGGFAVVGMWTHGAISFGSLVAAMISSVGDEAFVMLVQMPEKVLFLFLILFVIALVAGVLIDFSGLKVKYPVRMQNHLVVHEHEHLSLKEAVKNWKENFKQPSFTRVLLITGVSLFIVAMLGGFFEHDHSAHEIEHVASESIRLPFEEAWFNLIFVALAFIVLLTFIFVSDHFLEEHLWHHIIKQHVPKIALWTFGALLFITFFIHSDVMLEWVKDNPMLVVVLAVAIGLIPESGPHLIFVTLFVTGSIPFSVLLANSITQDGHSSLPLLAESKNGFLITKLINLLIGLAAGYSGILLGF